MITITHFEGCMDKELFLGTDSGITLIVKSFEDGIATVDTYSTCHIQDFADVIAGCLRVKSNFKDYVYLWFDSERKNEFKGIKFEFNGATVLVTRQNAYKGKIVAEWNKQLDIIAEKKRLEWEAYIKTPEYRAKRAKELKRSVRREKVRVEMLEITDKTRLKLKDKEAAKAWRKWVRVNSKSPYGKCAVDYACRWARYMQHIMKKHDKTVSQIADKTSIVADIDGVTLFIYGHVVAVLSSCWKYGEELRRWHNKQWDCENTDGVVNPAVLTIAVK